MARRVLGVAIAFALSAGTAAAQEKIRTGPIKSTPAGDGPKMFSTYCAVCHGKDATGNGPAAGALTKAPADLTRLSARNGGNFPDVRVKRYIEGADEVAAHGSRDMPMWGDLFRSLNRDTAEIRVEALKGYLKSLQK